MSERVEAAAKAAFNSTWRGASWNGPVNPTTEETRERFRRDMTAGIEAADAVERAVEVLLERWPEWCECRRSPFDKHNVNPPCNTRVKANAQVRAVVDALRGES
jgi:hypothetical protein